VNEELPHPDAGAGTAKAPGRPRVLVVDDEELVRLVLVRTLRLGGFDVFEASDGLEALACLPAVVPDLVLTDLNMPRCNGEQLCLEIKRQAATAGVHVVMMTGGPLDEARMRAIGCAAVIYKPLPDRLPEILSAVVLDTARLAHADSWALADAPHPLPARGARGAA
jgi:CheY-like chemotaxis protein